MDPMPITLTSDYDPEVNGLEVNAEWFRSWRPAKTIAVAFRNGEPVLMRDVEAEEALTLEWHIYARQNLAEGFGGWLMVDTGARLNPAALASEGLVEGRSRVRQHPQNDSYECYRRY